MYFVNPSTIIQSWNLESYIFFHFILFSFYIYIIIPLSYLPYFVVILLQPYSCLRYLCHSRSSTTSHFYLLHISESSLCSCLFVVVNIIVHVSIYVYFRVHFISFFILMFSIILVNNKPFYTIPFM